MTASLPPHREASSPRQGPLGQDAVQAALVGLLAFGTYLATLYPGLLAVGDAAKFSFVGKVLGTPHAPGYPLYVVVSHLFSHVPWGTLAYRMNALSALLGAIAVGMGYLIARRLGAGRAIAVSAALGLAFGNAFWSRALYAKGYTLSAALVSVGILLLLRWSETRRPRDLYWAAAIFALSIGNHLTVIALLPALVLFSLLTDPRSALRPRTLLVVALLVLLGLMQYGFIIVRTLQQAPYLEARAANLEELWQVMTARRFAHEIGAFSPSALMFARVPVVAGLVATELRVLGLLAALVGFAGLILRRPRHAVLFGLGALGVASLTSNMSSNEDEGFLLPVFVLLWPVAAVGLELTARTLQRASRRVGPAAVTVLALLLPCSQIMQNYRANDHHTETFETRYFDAFFAALPAKAAIVSDEYPLKMMVLYKLLGERANGSRDIHLITCDNAVVAQYRDQGFEVFAFQDARNKLATTGARLAPFTLIAIPGAEEVVKRREVYRVISAGTCLAIGNQGWTDISRTLRSRGRLSVKIDNYRPFDAQVTIYAGGDGPLAPSLMSVGGVGAPTLNVESFRVDDADAGRRLATRSAADFIALPDTVLGSRFVTRAEVRVNDRGAYALFALDFGEEVRAASARALVDRDDANRATVCAHELEDATVWPSGEARVTVSADAGGVEFGDGWYPLERRADGLIYRWTAERAVLILPLDEPRTAKLSVSAEPLDYSARPDGTLTLQINGYRLESQRLRAGRSKTSWIVARERWRLGLNEVVLKVGGARRPSDLGLSSDRRLLGVSVTAIELDAGPGFLGPASDHSK